MHPNRYVKLLWIYCVDNLFYRQLKSKYVDKKPNGEAKQAFNHNCARAKMVSHDLLFYCPNVGANRPRGTPNLIDLAKPLHLRHVLAVRFSDLLGI